MMMKIQHCGNERKSSRKSMAGNNIGIIQSYKKMLDSPSTLSVKYKSSLNLDMSLPAWLLLNLPANKYLFKVKNRCTRKRCKIGLKLTTETKTLVLKSTCPSTSSKCPLIARIAILCSKIDILFSIFPFPSLELPLKF